MLFNNNICYGDEKTEFYYEVELIGFEKVNDELSNITDIIINYSDGKGNIARISSNTQKYEYCKKNNKPTDGMTFFFTEGEWKFDSIIVEQDTEDGRQNLLDYCKIDAPQNIVIEKGKKNNYGCTIELCEEKQNKQENLKEETNNDEKTTHGDEIASEKEEDKKTDYNIIKENSENDEVANSENKEQTKKDSILEKTKNNVPFLLIGLSCCFALAILGLLLLIYAKNKKGE